MLSLITPRVGSPVHTVLRNGLITMLLALSLSRPVLSLESVRTLSGNALVAQVLKQNAGLSAKALRAKAATQRIDTAGTLDDPMINYSLAPNTVGTDTGTRQLFGISQAIPWPGKRSLQSERAEAEAKAASHSLQDGRLALIAASRRLWAQWWYVYQSLAINAANQQLLKELQAVVETQYANGLGLQQDLLQIQTASVHAYHQSIVLRQLARRISAQINALLNLPPTTAVPEPGPFPDTLVLPTIAALYNGQPDTDPRLLQASAKTQAAAATMNLVAKEDYPDFRLTAGFNELLDNNDKHLQIGVSVSIPLNTGKRSAAKSAASSDYHSARFEMQELRAQLAAELEQQLSLAQESKHVIDLYRSQLIPKSKQTLDAAQADYQAGRGEFANVIRAEQQLLTAQLNLANNQSQYFIAVAAIDRLSGGTLWPVLEVGNHEFNTH